MVGTGDDGDRPHRQTRDTDRSRDQIIVHHAIVAQLTLAIRPPTIDFTQLGPSTTVDGSGDHLHQIRTDPIVVDTYRIG